MDSQHKISLTKIQLFRLLQPDCTVKSTEAKAQSWNHFPKARTLQCNYSTLLYFGPRINFLDLNFEGLKHFLDHLLFFRFHLDLAA